MHLAGLHMPITIGLLALLAVVFLKGLGEAIGVAAAIALPYILLNVIVLMRGCVEIAQHPEAVANWQAALWRGQADWTGLLIAAALIFPKLALGLSGFETGVSVMPLVAGGTGDDAPRRAPAPRQPIRRTAGSTPRANCWQRQR